MKTFKELQKIATLTKKELKAKNIDQWELLINGNDAISASAQSKVLDKIQMSKDIVAGIRLIKNKKTGISYSENISLKSIKHMINSAIINSTFSKESDDQILKSELKTIEVTNNNTTALKMNEFTAIALELESAVLNKDQNVTAVPYSGISKNENFRFIATSHDVNLFESSSYFSCHTSALLDNRENKAMFHQADVALNLQSLDIKKCINNSYQNAKNLLAAKKISSGIYDVIFTPDILKQLFSVFTSSFSGKNVIEKKSFYADKLSKKIAHSDLSISHIPTSPLILQKEIFDDEGCLKSNFNIVENGILKNFLHNSETARFFKVTNNGCAIRSPKTQLGVSVSSLLVTAKNSAHEKPNTFLEIIELQGLHSGANMITGDFSLGFSGYLHKDGIICAVKECTVSGNFYEMLNSICWAQENISCDFSKTFFTSEIIWKKLNIAGI